MRPHLLRGVREFCGCILHTPRKIAARIATNTTNVLRKNNLNIEEGVIEEKLC